MNEVTTYKMSTSRQDFLADVQTAHNMTSCKATEANTAVEFICQLLFAQLNMAYWLAGHVMEWKRDFGMEYGRF